MKKKIWLSSPHMGIKEQLFVKDAFETNWIAPLGPHVDGFESDLQSYTGISHAVVLSSGTAALHLALILLGVKVGDEVICQSFTFSASANPIVYLGAKPVFVDSERETWNMCPIALEEAILDRMELGKKPAAIIAVHLYGMPAKMEEICRVASKFDIPVVEDAAEALGSHINGKMCGTFGMLNILSFNGNKIITTSGGGALISDDKRLIEKARFLATQARDPAPHYQHSEVGYNYRMSNILAGIGRGQMEIIEERIRRRRQINQWYRDLLKDVPGITFQTEPTDNYFSNYWLTCIIIDPGKSGTDREKVRLALEAENIESRPLWKPMHLQPVFKESPAFVNGTSEKLFMDGLCLPSSSNLTESDLNRIAGVLKKEFHI